MRIRARVASLLLFIVLLLVVGRIATSSFDFVLNAFWFNAGLLALLLTTLIDQPFYSTDSDIFLNAIAGAVSLLGIPVGEREPTWWAFLLLSVYLIVSSLVLIYRRSGGELGMGARQVQMVNAKIGRPRPLFSLFFLWGVLKAFGVTGPASNVLVLYWGLFVAFDLIGLGGALDRLLAPREGTSDEALGRVTGAVSPGVVNVELKHGATVARGDQVAVGSRGGGSSAGVLISDRALLGRRIGRVVLDGGVDTWAADRPGLGAEILVRPVSSPDKNAAERFVGVVESETDILTLRTHVPPEVELKQGELLWTWMDGRRQTQVFYQIVSGEVRETRVEDGEAFRSVVVQAQQVGIWEPGMRRFEPATWVARANAPVYRSVAADYPEARCPGSGRASVGVIPNSTFPVHVGVQDIVTHNAAILGVTGSGKSWLAFALIEQLIANRIKVFILDITRQHWLYLEGHQPRAIRAPSDLAPWLEDPDSFLAVNQFAAETGSLPQATATYAKALFEKLKETTRLQAGVDVPARVCIVLEEAHSLIPEWNQVAVKGDEVHVNATARVLLQGRKYGLGALIVSQRTANVTKTMLNQCNTIFALQSFDQTGLDFLRNYMGEGYAQAISTLPVRHCIVVGKASSCTRPVMCQITDLRERWPARDQARGVEGGAATTESADVGEGQ